MLIRSCCGLVVGAVMTLAGCAGIADMRGTGPLTLGSDSERAYAMYRERARHKMQPGYFAVSPDGRTYGMSWCPDHRCRGNYQTLALSSCNRQRPQPDCRLYARGDDIVWQF